MAVTTGSGVEHVFFRERHLGRLAGKRRSLRRAQALAPYLGIDLQALQGRSPWLITVVGSKGKGTMAAFASAVLHGAGLRVGTLTSPGLRSHRERIRVDGRAIGEEDFSALVELVEDAVLAAADTLPGDGYLSPTGLFTLAAIRHFLDSHCDVVVAEAGLGGRSDEVSLLAPDVVACGAVFAEHSAILGPEITDIAADKLGVVKGRTKTVVLACPSREIDIALRQLNDRGLRPAVQLASAVAGPLPPAMGGFNGANARAGIGAARSLLDQLGITPDESTMGQVLDRVRLPGRLSLHHTKRQTWLVDSAINAAGAEAALRHCRKLLGEPGTVLVSIPDDKDVDGVMHAVTGAKAVISLRVDAPHLSYASRGQELPLLSDLDPAALEPPVLAMGTVAFVGEVLQLMDADTSALF